MPPASGSERAAAFGAPAASATRVTVDVAGRPRGMSGDENTVLKAGQIADRGTHAALLRERGLYASMWDRQREATEAEERLRLAREGDELGVVVRRRTSEVN